MIGLYNMATAIANEYRKKVNTEVMKATGKDDYRIFLIGSNAYVFLHGFLIMKATCNETFLVGDGQTEVDQLRKLVIRKKGLFTGSFEEEESNHGSGQ